MKNGGVRARQIFLVILGTLTLFLILGQAFACTILYVDGAEGNYFASNEDWTFTDPALQVTPGENGAYSYIVFGWNSYLPGYPQGGINQYGVCLDWASVSPQPFQADPARKDLDEDLMYKILKHCRNVAEVIRMVRRYNCPHLAEEHLLVADRNGSCVIEWSPRGYVFLQKKGNYQVITNFCLSNPKIGWYPCARYQKANEILGGTPNAGFNFETVKEVLRQTHQEGAYPTVYSYIAATQTLDFFVFRNHDAAKYQKFNFEQEIKKGPHRIKL